MGTVNYGVQKHTFDYNQEATAKLFNIVNHKLTPSGIYAGFTLTKQSNTYVQVSTGICLIKDETAGVSVRVETEETQSVPVTNSTPYVVFRFEWADVQNNYMDMLSVAYEDILSTDIVVGRCVYDSAGTSMFDTFDYTRRSVQFLNKIESEKDYLRVLPTEPYSNQFLVTSGVLNSSKGNLIITGGTFPSGGLANTTNGRIDLVYIDENGVVQILQGTDSSSPVAPRYGNRKVIAEIRRGSARNSIRGTEIFSVISSFDSAAITSDQLITDSGSLYAATNVEDALQEIAGSAFTFKGAKIFNDLVTLLKSAVIRGASGSNILTLQKSDGTSVITVDQNGKLSTPVNPELPFTDSYSKYTTDRYTEALNQIAGESMTIDGTKTFTSSPVIPTPATGNSSTLAATTAFVNNEIANDRPYSDTNPLMNGTASQGSSARVSRQDHVHPTDTSRVPTSRSISAGSGLSGGGDLSANRSLTVLYESTDTNIKMNGTQSVGSLNTTARGDHVHPSDTSKLNASSYTANDVLAKIKSFDPASAGITANQALGISGYTVGNASGNIPVSNGTVCQDLNAFTLNGMQARNLANSIPISNGMTNTNLVADKLRGYIPGNASGNIPVSNGTVCQNLNAEMLGGERASQFLSNVSGWDIKGSSNGTYLYGATGDSREYVGGVTIEVIVPADGRYMIRFQHGYAATTYVYRQNVYASTLIELYSNTRNTASYSWYGYGPIDLNQGQKIIFSCSGSNPRIKNCGLYTDILHKGLRTMNNIMLNELICS